MIYLLLSALLLAADQISKWIVLQNLKGMPAQDFIPHVLQFNYVENRGIAFGMLQNMHWIIIPISILVMVACGFMGYKYRKKGKKMPAFALSMIVAGALGNLIDKIRLGYVVDFLETVFMDFPVFNLADVFICCGAALFAVYILFFEKEEQNGADL